MATEPVVHMSRESRRVAGILLLSIVAVEFGGYSLVQTVTGDQALTEFQRAFTRAGHAHAGVLVTLGLIGTVLADAARVSGALGHLTRSAIPAAAILMSAGFFLSSAGAGRTEPNNLVVLLWLGAAALAIGAVSLGTALLRGGEERTTPAAPATPSTPSAHPPTQDR
jgi:hypothetical protein